MLIYVSGVGIDCSLREHGFDRIRELFGLNAKGSWLLHKHTLINNLKKFIVFPSITDLFGNDEQANYFISNANIYWHIDSLSSQFELFWYIDAMVWYI